MKYFMYLLLLVNVFFAGRNIMIHQYWGVPINVFAILVLIFVGLPAQYRLDKNK